MLTVIAGLGAIFGGISALAAACGVITLALMPNERLWTALNEGGLGGFAWIFFVYLIFGLITAFFGGRYCWENIQSIRTLPANTPFYQNFPISVSLGITVVGLIICICFIFTEINFRN